MSIFLDRSFLLRVSPKLKLFSQRKEDLYNFRCPYCGDSQKNKVKARGYVYKKKNDYFYMCHNCGVSTSFYNFLNKVDPLLIKEYSLERYKLTHTHVAPKESSFDEFKTEAPKFRTKIDLPTIDELPDTHFAKQYAKDRMIPKEFWSDLFYAADFKKFVKSLDIEKNGLIDNDERLVIPFYDFDKNLVAFQGRTLTDSTMRYITVKVDDDNAKLFGLDRIDTKETIYVVEGPIDSMFLPNCVATADSNLTSVARILDKENVVLIFDNEPRNKDVCRIMEKAIDDHYRVVIWPEMIDKKDINDIIKDGFSPEEIRFIIDKHTHVNLRAKMEFVNWKKV
jgi:hypothetical protein